LVFPDILKGLTSIDNRAMVLRDLMQRDAIHPNASGVVLVVEAIGPTVLDLVARVKSES